MLQQCDKDCVVIGGRPKNFIDGWPYISRTCHMAGITVQEGCFCCLGRYWDVTLNSYMVRNVNVNIVLCFIISCEFVG